MTHAKKKKLTAILAICLVAVLAIGGTLAFLTDNDEVENKFVVGDIDIDLEEPGWEDPFDPGTPEDPKPGKPAEPGDTVDKDPTVTALAGQSYMRLVMTIVDENGTAITNAAQIAQIKKTLYYDTSFVPNADMKQKGTSSNIAAGTKYTETELADLVTAKKAINPFNTGSADGQFTLDTVRSDEANGKFVFNYNGIFDAEKTSPDKAVLFTHVIIPSNWDRAEMKLLAVGDDASFTGTDVYGVRYSIKLKAEAIQAKGFADRAEAFTALDAQIAANATP